MYSISIITIYHIHISYIIYTSTYIQYTRKALPCSVRPGWHGVYLIKFLIRNPSYNPCSEPSRTVLLLDVMYTTEAHHPTKWNSPSWSALHIQFIQYILSLWLCIYTCICLPSLSRPPGRSLVIGGGYVALETSGLLRGLGFEVSVMVRGDILRSVDK